MNKQSVNESRNMSWKGVHVSSHPGKRVRQPGPSAVLALTSVNLQVSVTMKSQHHVPLCRVLFIPGSCVLQACSGEFSVRAAFATAQQGAQAGPAVHRASGLLRVWTEPEARWSLPTFASLEDSTDKQSPYPGPVKSHFLWHHWTLFSCRGYTEYLFLSFLGQL